uniref:Tryptophan synthase beta chain n=1 Tax=uncultured Alphaproteobacteria bacterium TaxID=91750 RepID=A0A6G8F3C3_9PROT|nr:tryptophan synthase beta chain [uncultured Alphaproteobacteria bacterium]
MENTKGFFGNFGGAFIPEKLQQEMNKIEQAYNLLKNDAGFIAEMQYIRRTYQGRPTPITFAKNLTAQTGGAKIYLKREDLNHTGAHKINHCIGEVLLAKHLGKTKVIAETGAGQHGVALATAAAYLGLECEIHMGEIDIAKEHPNVLRMKLLGAKIVPATHGQKTLKEAVDNAFQAYLNDTNNSIYCIGSVVGPHPFPTMVRDYQSVIGVEAREQMLSDTGSLPDNVVACVGGGSNAMGIFSGFLNEETVALYGVEPLGKGAKLGEHAASITFGREGVMHGFRSLVLLDAKGEPAPVYSVASGLDYPSVGPEHAYLHSIQRVNYVTINDEECLNAFYTLSKSDGIIPALESAHAVAYAMKLAKQLPPEKTILVNLSGRGDKDIDFVAEKYGI